MTTYLDQWVQYRAVRLVHVRRDSEGRWFWYHRLCGKAGTNPPTWPDAYFSACWHLLDDCGTGKLFGTHIEADPDANTLRASWLCPGCRQYCASHTPCDYCMDEE